MFLIAEAGVNHDGSLDKAFRLVEAAKYAGADAVKFQFFDSRRLWGDDRIKHLELRFDDFVKLHRECEAIGIEFMCTPFGVAELTMLKPLLLRVKVASGCNNRTALLEAVNDTGLPVVLSTGMSEQHEIEIALNLLEGDVTLLQCTSSYPCRLEDVHLRAMVEMKNLGCPVGLSDHTTGITASIAATALGATVIEKHLTLDRKSEGPDHKSSITPREMQALRMAIVEVEAALGDAQKRVLPCEGLLRKAWAK